MSAYLILAGRPPVPVDAERVTLGRSSTNDVFVDHPTVSRMHAVIDKLGGGWSVRDLSSTNGTFVNGERVWTERPLREGDELRLGDVRVAFRTAHTVDPRATLRPSPAPSLTRRERDVLMALCRPLLLGEPFREPASIREVALALHVTEAAVKNHLLRLYAKFAIYGDEGRRRLRLANEAVRSGVVTNPDLRG
jgi:DNA-binding CsgD family transcriptional regulator